MGIGGASPHHVLPGIDSVGGVCGGSSPAPKV